ncbi:MAG: single-stranded DNA-binding protein [Patescibacteria group bacterium]
MYSLNRATIIGNLTRDPETKQIPSGQTVSTFGVATNRAWKDPSGNKQEQTEFHDVVAWGKLAEICQQYLTKGKKVYVEGRLQTRNWEGQDGVKRYKTEIIIENMIMLSSAGGNFSETKQFQNNSTPPPPAPVDDPSVQVNDEIRVDDIPF